MCVFFFPNFRQLIASIEAKFKVPLASHAFLRLGLLAVSNTLSPGRHRRGNGEHHQSDGPECGWPPQQKGIQKRPPLLRFSILLSVSCMRACRACPQFRLAQFVLANPFVKATYQLKFTKEGKDASQTEPSAITL